MSGFQTGTVREVTAISFARFGEGQDVHGPQISVGSAPSASAAGFYSDPTRPVSSDNMRRAFVVEVQDQLRQEIKALSASLRDVIEASTGEPLPEDVNLSQLMQTDGWSALPTEVREGAEAYAGALNSTIDALKALDASSRAGEIEAENEKLGLMVDQAIADQTDAKLAIVRAAKLMEAEIELAKLALFDTTGGDLQERMRAISRSTTEMELLGMRKDMIAEMKEDIERGRLLVTASKTTVWAHETVSVSSPTNDNVSVFVETRQHVAAASVTASVSGSALSLLR
ncbi:hypothetical protein [Roseobacter cerasinus]|nr:hypothetical protein [Roseobacter cerasinus]